MAEPMVLPADILFIEGSRLDEETRKRCSCGDGDFVITRPHSRVPSRVLNIEAAELLKLFRTPTTIVEAVLTQSHNRGADPEAALESICAVLWPFIKAKWLVPANSPEAKQIAATYSAGQELLGYTILACVQALEDTEVYQVRCPSGDLAALKMIRANSSTHVIESLDREAFILRTLDGSPAPRLTATGDIGIGHKYLVMSWCAGVRISKIAAEYRYLYGFSARRQVLELCRSLLFAYSQLHKKGVVHGDVYPKNVLVSTSGQVCIVDFGFSRVLYSPELDPARRHGVAEYYEPEAAISVLRNEPKPLPTPKGEQYALAVLIYHLITGRFYITLSATKEEMFRQIAVEHPLSFAELGLVPWPQMETILLKALSKDPNRRFASVAEFADAIEHLTSADTDGDPEHLNRLTKASTAFLARLAPENIETLSIPLGVPSCSVTYGAAGIAYAMYRAACLRSDPSLLACADAWSNRACRTIDGAGAFGSKDLGISHGEVISSIYYGPPGVHLVRALIAEAMGDETSLFQALDDYVRVQDIPCDNPDLTMGRSGALVGCALLLSVLAQRTSKSESDRSIQHVISLGQCLMEELWPDEPSPSANRTVDLGIAHGWAGICYAGLLWCEAHGSLTTTSLRAQLDELAALRQEHGRGVRWPIRIRQDDESHSGNYMESWCHGSPGHVHLWTTAYRVLGATRYLELAERAAWTTWEAEAPIGSLCCGYAGRSYALLDLFKHTGDRHWVFRATELASRAVEVCTREPQFEYSLFKGSLGAAVLSQDLEEPERALFPLFGAERI